MSAALAACAPTARETPPVVVAPPPATPPPPVAAAPPPAPSGESYETLLAAARARPQATDLGALRMAYARSEHYQPYARYPDDEPPMKRALDAEDWPSVLRIAEAALAQNYVRMRPHFYAMRAHQEIGDARAVTHHRAMFQGLARSISASGDGRSPATAMVVISIQEEYDMLVILGLQRDRQTLIHEAGRSYDRLDVQERDGTPSSLFFDVTLMLSRSPFAPPAR